MVCPPGEYYVKLEQLRDGSIVAVFKGSDGIVGLWGHLQCAISRDGGESWTPPRTIVQMSHDTDHMALGQTGDGALVLCFVQPHAYQNGLWDTAQVHDGPVYMVRSTDGGATWSAPVTIDSSSAPVPQGYNPHGKMAELVARPIALRAEILEETRTHCGGCHARDRHATIRCQEPYRQMPG